ncbi:hypothetical protein VTL71DRAFT_5672 [Oculimacula yallundae]|uniref:Uncharacterized protein n=1 Tax=Oculimacula yallundae TaxID=86028 RepID=A0ABR4BYB0_9HELO
MTTYLSDQAVITHLRISQRIRTTTSYRRLIMNILRWIFPSSSGFSVTESDMYGNTLQANLTVSSLLTRPGGDAYEYETLLGEARAPGVSWDMYAEHLHTLCASNANETKNV